VALGEKAKTGERVTVYVTTEQGGKFAIGSLTQVRAAPAGALAAARQGSWVLLHAAAPRAARAPLRLPPHASHARGGAWRGARCWVAARAPEAPAAAAGARANPRRLPLTVRAAAAPTGHLRPVLPRQGPLLRVRLQGARRRRRAARATPPRAGPRPAPPACASRSHAAARIARRQVTFSHTGSFPVFLTGHLSEDDEDGPPFDECARAHRDGSRAAAPAARAPQPRPRARTPASLRALRPRALTGRRLARAATTRRTRTRRTMRRARRAAARG
jgi:hypothetical protein